MTEWKLREEIITRSKANNWALAVEEWDLIQVEVTEEPQTCLCTHYPIKELCYLYSESNSTFMIP